MALIDSNRKTSEDEHDFFQTLPCQVKCLCEYLDLDDLRVLDAGAGNRRIANQLLKSFPEIRLETSEINSSRPDSDIVEFDFDKKSGISDNKFPEPRWGDFLKVDRKFNYVISNPPYSLKDEFVTHALEIAENVFMMFPLQVLNYIDFCEKWLDNPHYCGRITMYPKVILNPEGEYIQGGNTGYGWFHWQRKIEGTRRLDCYEVFEDIRKYK